MIAMAFGNWALFLALALAAVLTPGPAMLAILGHALANGARPTIPVVLGNATGAVILIGASVAGLAALLASVPYGLLVLKWFGALYLAWLALRVWRKPAPGPSQPAAPPAGSRYGTGVMIALSNPKALLFFGAVLPQFVDPTRPAMAQFAVMATTFTLLELAATGVVTFAAHGLAPLLRRAGVASAIRIASSAIMLAAAALIALVPLGRAS